MTALMPEDSKTQTEEIVVRFKTTRPRGLLLATSLENSSDRLQIYLEEGKAKMLIHIGDKEKVSVSNFSQVRSEATFKLHLSKRKFVYFVRQIHARTCNILHISRI